MANSSVVPLNSGDVFRTTSEDTNDEVNTAEPQEGTTSPQPAADRMEGLRKRYGQDISEEAFKLLCSSWRHSTEKSYSSAWNRWVCERGGDPFTPPVSLVLQFLTEEFQSGKQYSTLNSYRSALSATLPPMEGVPVGQHPMVSKLMQGIFNSRPPAPRYQGTWRVSTVVSYLSTAVVPTHKRLAVLMALSNAARSSDLKALDLRFRAYTQEGAHFRIPGLTKTRRSGPPREALFRPFTEDKNLCPVETLRRYEEETREQRKASDTPVEQPLFISSRRPYKGVCSSSIARWVKEVLKEAGIDTDTFKAHSTRSAAASLAKKSGMSTADIMQLAGWSRASTFERFYNKPLEESNRILSFASAPGESLNSTMSYMQSCHDVELEIPHASEGCDVGLEFH